MGRYIVAVRYLSEGGDYKWTESRPMGEREAERLKLRFEGLGYSVWLEPAPETKTKAPA